MEDAELYRRPGHRRRSRRTKWGGGAAEVSREERRIVQRCAPQAFLFWASFTLPAAIIDEHTRRNGGCGGDGWTASSAGRVSGDGRVGAL